jgi:hypothetical protein
VEGLGPRSTRGAAIVDSSIVGSILSLMSLFYEIRLSHLEKPLWEIWQIFAEVEKIFDKGEKDFPEFINETYIIQIWEMQKMLRKYVKFCK